MDPIDRQAAINALNEYFSRIGKLKRKGLTKGEKAIGLDTVGVIKSLPSAIVRCKDCKHHIFEDEKPGMVYCPEIISGWVKMIAFVRYGRLNND